jgi:alkylhydroperoxidase family enzyme
MAWIKTVPFTEAGPELKQALEAQHALYPKEYARDPGDDGRGSIVATHTLIPDALHHAFATFGALMSPALPLTRAQHEMITTRVSAVNRCHY